MTSKEFWGYVEEEKAHLIALHRARERKYRETGDPAAWEGQPEDGKSQFIVSIPRRGSGENPQCHEATTRLAAQRIVEQTHQIATADQIAAFLKLQETNAAEIRSIEEKMNNGPRAVVVRPAEPPTRVKRA